jgi:hypothetical protein
MRRPRLPGGLVSALALVLLACGPASLSEDEVVRRLAARGFTIERLDKAEISQGQLDRLPTPLQYFSIRVSDGKGNSETTTLLEFRRAGQAAEASKAKVNGFAARNWFFTGMARHFQDPIQEALK